ncbi:MAG: 6-bladed beta-propeller [Balneolaceae bacterium]
MNAIQHVSRYDSQRSGEPQSAVKKIILGLIIVLSACTEKNVSDENLPSHVRDMHNVNVYSIPEITNQIQLIKDQTYGDTEEIFFSRIGEFIVDNKGRIFIAEGAVGRKTIHVFDSDGNHLGNIGREGRGPGEFEEICCMNFNAGKLYINDPVQRRMSIYSLEELKFLDVYRIERMNLPETEIDGRFTGTYFFMSPEKILMEFSPPVVLHQNSDSLNNAYFYYDEKFNLSSSRTFELKQIPHHWGDFEGRRIRETFPFFEKSLIAVSNTGRIFTAMSSHFFIKELDQEGNYLKSFFYPHEKLEVTREDAFKSSNVMSRNIAENLELPEYWPVLNSMQFDDEDRLWISTFTENDDQLKWWVLNTDGELLGTFYFKGDRYGWPLRSARNMKVIQNGYFYAMERNDETELREIVRYRIKIE